MKAHAPYLPALVNAVSEAAGFEAAVKMARTLKGRRMSIPRTVNHDFVLVKLIGVKAATLITAVTTSRCRPRRPHCAS